MADKIEWIPVWDDVPDPEIEVIVLVKLKNGEFQHDIGRYYPDSEEPRWNLQFWKAACVVAYQYLPDRLVHGPA